VTLVDKRRRTDTMTQAQNEALISLLLAARYSDSKLSLSETDTFQKHVDGLPWDSGTSRDIFVQQATAAVRKALSTEEAMQELLEKQCARFVDAESKRNAFRTIESLMLADDMDSKESKLLLQIRSILKI
jgi:hypothetical protein